MQREALALRGELLSQVRVAAGVSLLAFVLASGAARGHGSAPAAVELLASDDGRTPSFVALSYGLARREEAGTFSFVCPAAWGSEDAVLAARGGVVAAVAGGRLHVSEGGCGFVPRVREEAMVDVVATEAGLFALGKLGASTRVLAVSATDTRVRAEAKHEGADACVLDAIVGGANGGLIGACASPRPALFVLEGDPVVRPFVLPFAPARLVPRVVADDGISVLAIAEKGSFVVDLDRHETAAPPRIAGPFATVLGPVVVAGARVAVIDGHLWERRDGTWSQGLAVPYTCLSQVGVSVFACSLGTTVRLERQADAVVAAEPVFSLAMVGEPTASCAEASGDAPVCRGEWSHFGAEAGLLDTLPARSPEAKRSPKPVAPGADETQATHAEEPSCALALAPGDGARRVSGGFAWLLAAARLGRARSRFPRRPLPA